MARSSVVGNAVRVEPCPEERASAERVVESAAGDMSGVVLRLPGGKEIALPESLAKILLASANELSEGHAVTVLPSDVCLSPAEVGELLGLSRPFVARLLDAGEMPSQRLPGSRHRVVRLADVLEFQARRERRRSGRHRIADAVESAELPY